jgi:hypothetical protein
LVHKFDVCIDTNSLSNCFEDSSKAKKLAENLRSRSARLIIPKDVLFELMDCEKPARSNLLLHGLGEFWRSLAQDPRITRELGAFFEAELNTPLKSAPFIPLKEASGLKRILLDQRRTDKLGALNRDLRMTARKDELWEADKEIRPAMLQEAGEVTDPEVIRLRKNYSGPEVTNLWIRMAINEFRPAVQAGEIVANPRRYPAMAEMSTRQAAS